MRILHVNAAYAPFVGGAETYTREISERLTAQGHAVVVATTNAAEVEAFWHPAKQRVADGQSEIGNVQVYRGAIRYLPLAPLSLFALRRLTVEAARYPTLHRFSAALGSLMPWTPDFDIMINGLPGRFDVVHGINIALERPAIAAWRFARQRRLPFVITPFVHTGEAGSRFVSRNYTMPHQLAPLRDADAVIVQTDLERDCLIDLGVARDRLHVLGMGVELDATRGGDGARFRQQAGIPHDAPIVLFMGVITRDKGALHLIEAMQHIWASDSRPWLVLAGHPVDEFETFWRGVPEQSRRRIIRAGVVTGVKKQDILNAADVLALPSRVDSFGIVILEAWACGKPVVGARAGGIPGVITEERDGLLVDYGDVGELARLLRHLLDNPALREQLGSAGRAKVEQRFTWDRIVHRLVAIYTDVLSTR